MLIEKLISQHKGNIYSGVGDNFDLHEILSSQSLQKIKSAFEKYDLIFIDEAQLIPNIGYSIKLLIDNMPDKTVILTGSSSFEFKNGKKSKEPKQWRAAYPDSEFNVITPDNFLEFL